MPSPPSIHCRAAAGSRAAGCQPLPGELVPCHCGARAAATALSTISWSWCRLGRLLGHSKMRCSESWAPWPQSHSRLLTYPPLVDCLYGCPSPSRYPLVSSHLLLTSPILIERPERVPVAGLIHLPQVGGLVEFPMRIRCCEGFELRWRPSFAQGDPQGVPSSPSCAVLWLGAAGAVL